MVQMNLLQRRRGDTDTEDTHLDMGWGRRWGGGDGMNWEIGLDIYTPPRVK